MAEPAGVAMVTLGVLPLAIAYYMPTIVAWRRRLRTVGTIFLINTIAGWSGIGWFILLIWAAREAPRGSR